MTPLLIPRSQGGNKLLQQTLPNLTSHFQIREIDDSPTTPGDLVFPSLGVACLVIPPGGDWDSAIIHARTILQRRRCLMFVPEVDVWDVQLRYHIQLMLTVEWRWSLIFSGEVCWDSMEVRNSPKSSSRSSEE